MAFIVKNTTYDYSFRRNPGEPFVVFRGTKVSPLHRWNTNEDQKMLRCVLKHSKASILKGYTVHKYCKKKSKMSSNRMKVADCCTTIVHGKLAKLKIFNAKCRLFYFVDIHICTIQLC